MKKTIVTLSALLVLACVLGAQQGQPPAKGPAEFKIPPEAAAKVNPVKPTPDSLAKAKKTYAIDCAMCHGEKGDGKGEMVEEMKINPPDFTKPETLAKRTDGELFTIIQIGNSTMPAQGERMKDVHKWEVVNYLRSLSGKTPLKSTEEELLQDTVVVKEKEKDKN